MKYEMSKGAQLIIAGLCGLVEDEGYTPHDAFAKLDEIKRDTFHALAEIYREARTSEAERHIPSAEAAAAGKGAGACSSSSAG